MSEENITPEEVDALTTEENAPAQIGVLPRDFRQPKRLSSEQLEDLRVGMTLELKEVSKVFKPWLRSDQNLTLQTVSEVSFRGIMDAVDDPVCVMLFTVGDQVGWLVWETTAALAVTARAMGVEPTGDADEDGADSSEEEQGEATSLSSVEASIACKVLGQVLNALGAKLGLSAGAFRFLQTREELEHSIVELRGQDEQRLRVDLELDGPEEPSTLKLYLPGVVPSAEDSHAIRNASTVPQHLAGVGLELRATFDPVELPLDDLLALEVGDVIPLTTRVDESLQLTIEELGCAHVRLGQKDGQLAVRLEQLVLDVDLEGRNSPS